VRQAAIAALNQPAFLKTQVVISARYRTCFSVYPCGTPYFTTKGMDYIAKPDIKRARQLLTDSGYDGTPVVILQPTDNVVIAKLPLVAAQLLREAGFKVDLQPMDFGTVQARTARKDGWNIFLSGGAAVDRMNPISNYRLSGACEKASSGWPCDQELEKLRDEFARSFDDKTRKALAEQVQVRAMEIGAYVPLGEYVRAVAARRNVTGFVNGYMTVFWNVEKQ
jgi:peptide/nickel transport system substrate-binding protein